MFELCVDEWTASVLPIIICCLMTVQLSLPRGLLEPHLVL